MGIREQYDIFETLYESNLSRLELIQLISVTTDMVRDQVNNGRINGCKILTNEGVEEIIHGVKEDSHLIKLTHPNAYETKEEQESVDKIVEVSKKDRSAKVMLIQKSMNFSANVSTKRSLATIEEDETIELHLRPSPILPESEKEWMITIRTPSEHKEEASAQVVVEVESLGARRLNGN